MTPAEIIESARLHGAHLSVNPRGELQFAASLAWYSRHKADLKEHHRAIVLLLKYEQARGEGMGKVIEFRRRDGQTQPET